MKTIRGSTTQVMVALVSALALGLLTCGLAVAAEPSSMSEARETGDPAADAAVLPVPDTVTYYGKEIDKAAAVELGLACMQTAKEYICKDSTDEFGSGDEAAAARRNTRKGGAHASAACGVNALWVYQHKQYEGWALGVGNNFYKWVDIVGSGTNDEVTSYRTGEAAAHLSEHWNGNGYWYPGDTGYCSYHSNISQPYPAWNDRISSRYRF
jgi:hypothetical protein